jgi:pyruvate,water dikinase
VLKEMNFLKNWHVRRSPSARDSLGDLFRFKYSAFRMLLDSNTQLLKVIADMEEKLCGRQVFGISYVRTQAGRAIFHALRMVKNLDDLSNHRYPRLFEALEKIDRKIQEEMGPRKESPPAELILTYDEITKEMADWVGGKNANLGEIHGRLRLPVPEGFAITTRGFTRFLSHNGLFEKITTKKMEIDPCSPETIAESSREIQQLITSAEVPSDLDAAIRSAYDRIRQRMHRTEKAEDLPRISLRSSATGEDAELSSAGQYLSVLNVTPDQLISTYKRVVASLYTAPAVAYRLNKGIRDEDIAMSVACLAMVESVASGVIYTHHPFDFLDDNIMITAVWGLGPYAVEGRITPDSYTVDRRSLNAIVRTVISHKPVQLVNLPEGGLQELSVKPEMQDAACLSPQQIGTLAGYALALETHYKHAQDIEWALDREGRLLILQSRPLHVQSPEADIGSIPAVSGYPLLIKEGAVAYPGIGCGPAFQVHSEEDLKNFPEGAVLVAKHSSPMLVMAMKKARAILTDVGSVAGHMASLAREFAVPAILDTRIATATIPTGMEITVDSFSGIVYQGTVPELLSLQKTAESPMKETPVYEVLRKVADFIAPLTFTDPKAPNFAPEFCQTLHDIGRLVHELSYTEMFQIGDSASGNESFAVKLKAAIPLDLCIIDLGGGIAPGKEKLKSIKMEDISSAPFRALLRGLTHEGFRSSQPRPINLSGFVSVVMEQVSGHPQTVDRFGERSFAVVSDNYLNFSSRVGYHYSALDSYCGPTIDMNYISFSFKGGAADSVRRNRRVRAIALVLKELDFAVDVQGDLVSARLQKYECDLIMERLDLVGRLLLYTRQMDMLMQDEGYVRAMAKNFLSGNYSLDRNG